jgi:hypothetical protein
MPPRNQQTAGREGGREKGGKDYIRLALEASISSRWLPSLR